MVLVRSENHWSRPWLSEMVATTATMMAGTAAATANIVTMRNCRPEPACPRTRDCTSSIASVTTSAMTSSTNRPFATQMRVQTSGVGSMLVAPVMIRNEPEAVSTDSTTTIRPTARRACRPRSVNRDRDFDEGSSAAPGMPLVASAVSLMSQTVSRKAAKSA